MPKVATHHKGGRHHNLIRSAHNDDTHKYEKQRVRTAQNKAKHIARAKQLKALADTRKVVTKAAQVQTDARAAADYASVGGSDY